MLVAYCWGEDVGVWFCACGVFVTTTLPSGRVTVTTGGGAAARLRPVVGLGEATARLRPLVLVVGVETARRLVAVDAAGVATARLRPEVVEFVDFAAVLLVVAFVLVEVVEVVVSVIAEVDGCASETPLEVVACAVPTRTPAEPLTMFEVVPVAVRLLVVAVLVVGEGF